MGIAKGVSIRVIRVILGWNFAKNFTNHVDDSLLVFKITAFRSIQTVPNEGPAMNQDPTPREMGYYAALAQVGLEMVLPAVLGYYLDSWLSTTPWLMIATAVLGFAAGLIHLFAILRRKERDESSEKRPPP